MNKNYLDITGLTDILQRLKAKFAGLVHTHTKKDITDYMVDTELSSTSTNPVENKTIKAEFDLVDNKIQTDIDSLRNEFKTYVDEMSPGVDDGHTPDVSGQINTHNTATDAHNDIRVLIDALQTEVNGKASSSDLITHTDDTTVHITAEERINWNDAVAKEHEHSNKEILDNTTASYTTEDKDKLDETASGVINKADISEEETNTELSYTKDIPSDVAKYAKVNMIGGMTRKSKNLFGNDILADTIVDKFGGAYKNESSKFIEFVSSSASDEVVLYNTFKPNTQYTFIFYGKNSLGLGAVNLRIQFSDDTYSDYLEFTSWGTSCLVYTSPQGKSVKALICGGENTTEFRLYYDRCGIFEGVITLDESNYEEFYSNIYEPCFIGLRSTPVTEVESVGKNIFGGNALADKLVEVASATKDESKGTIEYTTTSVAGKVLFDNFKPNTQYTFIVYGIKVNTTNVHTNLIVNYMDGTSSDLNLQTAGETSYAVIVSDKGKSVKDFRGSYKSGTVTLYYDKCGVFEGVLTTNEFESYPKGTLPIPEAVQALEGYGEGINETVYNYVDWEKKQFVRNVGKVDLGTLEWGYADVYGSGVMCFYSYFVNAKGAGAITTPIALCSLFGLCTPTDMSIGNTEGLTIFDVENTMIIIRDTSYIDSIIFKAAMSGVMLCYELATPEIIDISDILTDNTIPVEGGGTLTCKNQYEYDVPSEVTYYNNNNTRVAATDFVGDLVGTAQKAIYDGNGNNIAEKLVNVVHIGTTDSESEEDPTPVSISVIDPAGAEESDIGMAADAYKTKVAMSNADVKIKELEDENAELKAQITELNSKMPINGQQYVDFIISSQSYDGGVAYLSNSVYLPTGYSMSLVSVIACGASGDFVPDLQLQHFGNYWRVITLNTNLAGCMMQCEILVSKDD